MTLLATYNVAHFSVSQTEIFRAGSSYTLETLQELHLAMRGAKFFFITGLDAILSLPTWKNYEILPELCTFVTVTRPGYSSNELTILPEKIRNALLFVEIPPFSVSSTYIRQRISQGKGIKYLVPEPVEYYIYKEGLYKGVAL
jgi:nicotinate-nucleotide adenylyltransferase